MRGKRIFRFLKFAVIFAVAVVAFGFVVSSLWNHLLPPLFGFHMITFWQALGLMLLGRLLFGGFRGGPKCGWRRRMRERWEQMTPEQREKFREGLRGRCGEFRPPVTEPKP